jgi:hypothetical protein
MLKKKQNSDTIYISVIHFYLKLKQICGNTCQMFSMFTHYLLF